MSHSLLASQDSISKERPRLVKPLSEVVVESLPCSCREGAVLNGFILQQVESVDHNRKDLFRLLHTKLYRSAYPGFLLGAIVLLAKQTWQSTTFSVPKIK